MRKKASKHSHTLPLFGFNGLAKFEAAERVDRFLDNRLTDQGKYER